MSVTKNILKVKNTQGVITSIMDRGADAKLYNQEYQAQLNWYNSKGKFSEEKQRELEKEIGLFSYTSGKPFQTIPLDVVVRYSPEASTSITSNPTQIGVNVNDHVYNNPDTLTINFGISDIRGTLARLTGVIKSFTSVDALKNPQTPSRALLDLLYKAKQEHTLLALDDGLHTYKDMVITNISYDKDKSTYRSLVATVVLQQFIFVNTLEESLGASRPEVVLGKNSTFAKYWKNLTAIRLV